MNNISYTDYRNFLIKNEEESVKNAGLELSNQLYYSWISETLISVYTSVEDNKYLIYFFISSEKDNRPICLSASKKGEKDKEYLILNKKQLSKLPQWLYKRILKNGANKNRNFSNNIDIDKIRPYVQRLLVAMDTNIRPYDIHHEDLDRLNNKRNNLSIRTKGEHTEIHENDKEHKARFSKETKTSKKLRTNYTENKLCREFKSRSNCTQTEYSKEKGIPESQFSKWMKEFNQNGEIKFKNSKPDTSPNQLPEDIIMNILVLKYQDKLSYEQIRDRLSTNPNSRKKITKSTISKYINDNKKFPLYLISRQLPG